MSFAVFQPVDLMDGISANHLRCNVDDALAHGVKTILIDLQDVIFMYSSAIGSLVATLKVVQGEGGTLSLCSLNGQVRTIFELTRMDNIFDIYADRQDFVREHGISIS